MLLRLFPSAHRRAVLGFVLAALGMQALVPAGLMVTPAPGYGAQIILCPQTHPLARAAAAQASAETAAMHAAMGHQPAPDDDAAPVQSTASSAQSCAFAGAGALAGLLPDQPVAHTPLAPHQSTAPEPLRQLHLVATYRLRPPLRAPPALI